MSDVQLLIRIDDSEDLAAAQALADEFPEVEIEATSGPPAADVEGQIEPISAVLVVAGATLVVKFLTDWWEKRRGGLVIDQRAGRPGEIYRVRDLPYGYVAIFPTDGGSVKLETMDMPKDAMQQLLESVINGVFGSATDIAKAARQTLCDKNVQVADT